jgi:hypothetical protein
VNVCVCACVSDTARSLKVALGFKLVGKGFECVGSRREVGSRSGATKVIFCARAARSGFWELGSVTRIRCDSSRVRLVSGATRLTSQHEWSEVQRYRGAARDQGPGSSFPRRRGRPNNFVCALRRRGSGSRLCDHAPTPHTPGARDARKKIFGQLRRRSGSRLREPTPHTRDTRRAGRARDIRYAGRAQEKFLGGCAAADPEVDFANRQLTPETPGARDARKKNFWAAAPPRIRESTSRSRTRRSRTDTSHPARGTRARKISGRLRRGSGRQTPGARDARKKNFWAAAPPWIRKTDTRRAGRAQEKFLGGCAAGSGSRLREPTPHTRDIRRAGPAQNIRCAGCAQEKFLGGCADADPEVDFANRHLTPETPGARDACKKNFWAAARVAPETRHRAAPKSPGAAPETRHTGRAQEKFLGGCAAADPKVDLAITHRPRHPRAGRARKIFARLRRRGSGTRHLRTFNHVRRVAPETRHRAELPSARHTRKKNCWAAAPLHVKRVAPETKFSTSGSLNPFEGTHLRDESILVSAARLLAHW